MADRFRYPAVAVLVLALLCWLPVITDGVHAGAADYGYLLLDDQGNVLEHHNEDQLFIPASVLKILTGLTAMETLKKDFRFQTWYAYDLKSGDFFIKGYGDPLFISEVIRPLCDEAVDNYRFKTIRNIICDGSFFSNDISISGRGSSLNPYDSPVGALSANFNTIFFKWHPNDKKFVSAEPQTPLLDIYNTKLKKSGFKNERIVLSSKESRLYAGHLVQYFFQEKGIKFTGRVIEGRMDTAPEKTFVYTSPYPLHDIVRKMLKFSNNFMANQLLLTVGAETLGSPATLENGLSVLNRFSKQTLNLSGLDLAEGSGLSRKNRVTPRDMARILIAFKPYYRLLNKEDIDFYKTGTLSDVRTRAGFFLTGKKKLYPYVIMVNQENKGYQSIYKKLLKKMQQETGDSKKEAAELRTQIYLAVETKVFD